jgi:hypothetical protein
MLKITLIVSVNETIEAPVKSWSQRNLISDPDADQYVMLARLPKTVMWTLVLMTMSMRH